MGDDGISVVVTVRNDRAGLLELLESLRSQDRAPDEIVVVDGGSTDGTFELLSQFHDVTVLRRPGANISAGRNEGIRHAAHSRIALTDAGCRPVKGWLSALADALDEVSFAVGVYRLDTRTPFERCLGVALYPAIEEIGSTNIVVRLSHRFFGRAFHVRLGTGRSLAFRRSAWAAVGGFPEDLYTGEDTWFSGAVIDSGATAALVKEAEVLWRPRETWSAIARMYRLYARGDVRKGNRRRYLARAAVWLVGPSALLIGSPISRFAVGLGAATYLALPFARAARTGLPLREWWRLPLLVAMKDLVQLVGAGQGLFDAARKRDQPNPTMVSNHTLADSRGAVGSQV